MGRLFAALFRLFLSVPGVVVLAALDSSLVFFFPLGIDVVVILVSARSEETAWLVPALATVGSLAGAAVTFWIGRTIGEHGLGRVIDSRRVARVKQRVTRSAAASIAALALIPPPFPFTPFILTSGALDVSRPVFFGTLAAARLARFGVESWLARLYGGRILVWMESETFELAIASFIVIALAGTAVSAWRLVRSVRRR
jgi:membrane protein YqaA with SNARE-associated domain